MRFALGASRARIIGQLFVEALVLASVAAAVGLLAADRAVTWGIENFNRASGSVPFWVTPGLKPSTILYAGGLAVASDAMLSLLPALKATEARVQSHLANRGAGGATLRFGRVWTGAMIVQVALTAIGIPVALESAVEALRTLKIRAEFPSGEYLAARIDVDRPFEEEATSAFEARRARTFEELQRRIAQEPSVVAVTFADRAPGSVPKIRFGEVESSPDAGPAYDDMFWTSEVGPGFFEALDRPIVAGRGFHGGDRSPRTRTVIVNEAFAHEFSRDARSGSPLGARLRYPASSPRPDAPAAEPWFEIVGVVRDVGLNPDDWGDERPYVFHAAAAGTLSPLVTTVRVRGDPTTLAARLPVIAADVDAGLFVQDARPLSAWIRQRDVSLTMQVGALAGVTSLVLFLSALGIFSLVSVSVSRRTSEIGLRAALGANAPHLPRRNPVPRHGAGGERHDSRSCRSAVVRGREQAHGRICALRRVSWSDIRGDARRESACLHRARQPRAQDRSSRRPEGSLNLEGVENARQDTDQAGQFPASCCSDRDRGLHPRANRSRGRSSRHRGARPARRRRRAVDELRCADLAMDGRLRADVPEFHRTRTQRERRTDGRPESSGRPARTARARARLRGDYRLGRSCLLVGHVSLQHPVPCVRRGVFRRRQAAANPATAGRWVVEDASDDDGWQPQRRVGPRARQCASSPRIVIGPFHSRCRERSVPRP